MKKNEQIKTLQSMQQKPQMNQISQQNQVNKSFIDKVHELSEQVKSLRQESKDAIENADRREKKKIQEVYDTKIAELINMLTVAKEANWLYEKLVMHSSELLLLYEELYKLKLLRRI